MIVYYIEVNMICIIILWLLRLQLKSTYVTSSEQKTLILMIWATIAFCISDMVAGVFRGMMFTGARTFIQISNLMYYETLALLTYLWSLYAHRRLFKSFTITRKKELIWATPFIAFTIIALSNPITHILFNVNSENLYERNIGVYIHWIIIWTYFLVPSLKALNMYLNERSILKKQEILPLLLFTVAPLITSIIQMCFYGVTTTQVGITFSIMLICLKSQELQMQTDTLTGLDNRRSLEYFVANQLQHNKDALYTLIMIDVDWFKQINDKYGHMMGDLVLKRIAEALKTACTFLSNRVHLSRFGGDEFIILGIDCTETEYLLLTEHINDEIEKAANMQTNPCQISVSIGSTQGRCTQESDFKALVENADKAMYNAKKNRVQKKNAV